MARQHRYVRFEALIELQDAGDWLKGEYLYVCRGRKQISRTCIEGLQISKDKSTTGQIQCIEFLLQDILKEGDNDSRPFGLARIGELALLLKREYFPDANSFVWRGLRRIIQPMVVAETEYKLTDRIGKLFMGEFEFYQINPSYFRERQEAIRQCIEQYHAREARKADKTKSSSEPQP